MSDVLIRVHGGLGRITLNRPKAVNALNLPMVQAIAAALATWEHDDRVRAVLVDGAGDRGLCAGGDVKLFYADARSGTTASLLFWAAEYRLNAQVSRYPKPYVALMDGLVMGGGVGISAHGGVRVVTERTRLSMPEVGIGFVPDVGGTYLLSRLPGELGTHAALTAEHLSGADTLHCGLADHYVSSDRLDALVAALVSWSTTPVDDDADAATAATAVVRRFASAPPPSELASQAAWIDASYAAATVEEVLDRLADHGGAAAAAAKEIQRKSPTALKVTLRALRRAADLPSLEAALEQEYRVSARCLRSPDLAEGIRAQVVDKDREPRWSPATLDEVDDTLVGSFFAALGDGELSLA